MALTDAPARDVAADDEEPPPQATLRLLSERTITIVTLGAALLFIFLQLQPSLLFASTTPAGGDMGAHVWAPAFLRDHLLPSARLTGWTPDWYAGFPAFHYYMVLPSLAIVALDLVLPYGVAFKLVTISGLLALPVALYLFGRLSRIPFPGPLLLGVAAVPFLFDRSFSIYGGNVPSTLAGEFAFSMSLAFAVVFLGVLLRGMDTGKHRGLAAGLLALTALCHLIPAMFAILGALVAFALRSGRARAWWLATTGVVAGALTAWWTLPFVWRAPYMNDMGWEKVHQYWESLFPGRIGESISRLFGGEATAAVSGDMTWVIVFAVVGFGTSIALRRRVGIYLGVLAVACAVVFRLSPQTRFWNARFLPFFYLCLYLLMALAIAEIVQALAVLLSRNADRPLRWTVLAAPAVVLLGFVVFLGMSLRVLPFGHTSSDGATYSWMGLDTTDHSYIPDWAKWNYSGYERKTAYPEYKALVDEMATLGKDPEHGCGRAMWEYESQLDRFGTPMALMLLPYWTDECIGSMEGLYFEASTTTPYHFLNQSELSAAPSRAQRDLKYRDLDVDLGVQHLQLMGVKYYMAFSPTAVAQAANNPDLTEVATSPGQNGEWHVYEVADAPLVEAMTAEPAVVIDLPKGGRKWQDMAQAWYLDPSQWKVLLAAGGPKEWQRITTGAPTDTRPVDAVKVSNITEGTSTMSFDVDEVGTPVLVKTSYFPNWEAHGADGPWRVAPNLMVVVPTSKHVELRYGRSAVEWFAWLITFAGIAALLVFFKRQPLVIPELVERRRRWRLRLEKVDELEGFEEPEELEELETPEELEELGEPEALL